MIENENNNPKTENNEQEILNYYKKNYKSKFCPEISFKDYLEDGQKKKYAKFHKAYCCTKLLILLKLLISDFSLFISFWILLIILFWDMFKLFALKFIEDSIFLWIKSLSGSWHLLILMIIFFNLMISFLYGMIWLSNSFFIIFFKSEYDILIKFWFFSS